MGLKRGKNPLPPPPIYPQPINMNLKQKTLHQKPKSARLAQSVERVTLNLSASNSRTGHHKVVSILVGSPIFFIANRFDQAGSTPALGYSFCFQSTRCVEAGLTPVYPNTAFLFFPFLFFWGGGEGGRRESEQDNLFGSEEAIQVLFVETFFFPFYSLTFLYLAVLTAGYEVSRFLVANFATRL